MNTKLLLRIAIAAILMIGSEAANAQGLSINTDHSTADPSAMLDVKSTTQGVLVPRMTNAQLTAITTAAPTAPAGLLVYQTDGTPGFMFWNGSAWISISETQGADIASATTTDIGAATGIYINVTGNTTITSFGSTAPAGTRRIVQFSGALTLTYSASSLILPGAASITTAAGDVATFISLGSGNWICVSYLTAATTGTGASVFANSPTFTGTPTAVTASPGDNTAQIATDAFVTGAISTSTLTLSSNVWNIAGNAPGATATLGTTDNSGVNFQTGTGDMNISNDAAITNVNIGTGGAVKTIAIGGTSANPITIGNTQTGGSITMGGAMTGGTITLGNQSGTQTGAILIGGGTETGGITVGGGTGAQALAIGGSGANTITLGDAQTGGSISLGSTMTGGTINIGGTGAQTGGITIGGGTGAQALAIGGTGANTITLGNTQTGGSIAMGGVMTTGTINLGSSAMTGGITLQSGTGDMDISNDATVNNVNIGTGAAVKTIAIGGTGANPITIGNTQTAGSISIGGAMTSNAITIGNSTAGSAGSTTINGGTGGMTIGNTADARTWNVGAGNAIQTVNLFSNATPVNVITLGGAASELGFFGTAPVAQPASGANISTALNSLGLVPSGVIDLSANVGTSVLPVANGGTGTGTAGIGAFNNITGYTATGATGATTGNIVFDASPTLTTPSATTASPGTNTNQIATTAFVTGAVATSTLTLSSNVWNLAGNAPGATKTLGTTDGSGVNFQTGAGALNISNDAATTTVNVGTGAGVKTVALGSTNTTSGTTVQSGTAGISVTATNGPIVMTTGTGDMDISNDATANNVNIGTGGAVKTIAIGGTGANVITIGNTQTGGSISLGGAMTTGTVTVGGAGAQLGFFGTLPVVQPNGTDLLTALGTSGLGLVKAPTLSISDITGLSTTYLPLAGGNMAGAINEAAGTTIASAATTTIDAAAGNYITVSGTTTITSLGTATQAGERRIVNFSGALTLTNGASLVLPGGANITTTAGDVATFVATSTSAWQCVDYLTASGAPVVGDGILPAANGGTGVNNGTNKITLGGSISTAGTFTTTVGSVALAADASGASSVTLPASGTLMTNTLTTTGDMIYSSSGSTPANLAIGTSKQYLGVNTGGTAPQWKTPTTTPTASTLAGWDGNINLSANSVIETYSTTATAGATTTLLVGSAEQQYFTGVTTQSVTLASTGVVAGQRYIITNKSTGSLIVQATAGGNTVATMPANTTGIFTCTSNGGGAGNWNASFSPNSTTGVLPVSLGGTGNSSLITTPTANTIPGWDGNINLSANSVIETYSTTATAGATTTLLVGSAEQQYFTGVTTQSVTLASTGVVAGQQYIITNKSTGSLIVQATAGGNTVATMPANTTGVFTCTSNGGGAGNWNASFSPNSTTGVLPVSLGGTGNSSLITTPTANTIPGWDGNINLSANSVIETYSTTATAGATTTLLVGSAEQQYFTGVTTQSVTLASTGVVAGQQYIITNKSTGSLIVQTTPGTTLEVMAPNTTVIFTCTAAGGGAGNWSSNNSNLAANNVIEGQTTTVSGTPLVLTSQSPLTEQQIITGNTAEIVTLPSTGVVAGEQIKIISSTITTNTGTVTVNATSGLNPTVIMQPGTESILTAVAATPSTAAGWAVINGGGALFNVRAFGTGTAINGATYTPTPGTTAIMVEVIGGGGGGGAANTSSYSAGSGGGSGGYVKGWITGINSSTMMTYTVAGSASSAAGGTGSQFISTSPAATLTAGGGVAGTTAAPTSGDVVPATGGTGGSATGGFLNLVGGQGGWAGSESDDVMGYGGAGGNTPIFGGGGQAVIAGNKTITTQSGLNGINGTGGGGSGGANGSGSTASAGGTGGSGIIIIYEYH